ncbi:MAG: hypothetical protein ACRCW4_11420 [Candidatus Neomicrothrix subdominans]
MNASEVLITCPATYPSIAVVVVRFAILVSLMVLGAVVIWLITKD